MESKGGEGDHLVAIHVNGRGKISDHLLAQGSSHYQVPVLDAHGASNVERACLFMRRLSQSQQSPPFCY